MEYHGKLYGKIGNKYFDTSKTSDDYDNLEKQNKSLLDEIDLVNNINGKLNDNNIKLLDEIERLKFDLKAADSVNEGFNKANEEIIELLEGNGVPNTNWILNRLKELTNQNK